MKFFKDLYNKALQQIKKVNKRHIAIVCLIAFAFSVFYTSYVTLSATHINSMTITLNYEGAKKGLNPDGSRFNIGDIKSDEVLKKAINNLGDDSLSVDALKSRIFINAKMPRSAVDQTTQAIASGSSYSYNPSEFEIFYSQKNKFGKNNTVQFIKALSEAYNEYFISSYAGKNTILKYDKTEKYSQYDYQEIEQVLEDKVSSMISYLGTHQDEDSTFRSQNTGYSFENLASMLINLRDIDLAKLQAYIVQNRISKNRTEFIRKQEYRVDKGMLQFNMSQQSSDIINSSLNIYDAQITGVAFIPSVDQYKQFYMSRTKTGLDNLVNRSYDEGIKATNFKKNIDAQNDLISKYQSASDTPENIMKNTDKMIADISEYIDRISELSIQTDNDYISNKTNDYITFKLPTAGITIPIVLFFKNFILSLILIIIAIKFFKFSLPWILAQRELLRKKLKLDNED